MTGPIKVIVHGALGRMGREVTAAVSRDPELRIVGVVEKEVEGDHLSLPDGSGVVPLSSKLESLLNYCQSDVVVDFSTAEATMPMVRTAAYHRVNLVIGTTGLSTDDLAEIEKLALANQVGAIVTPNFALGAVLLIHLAKVAARFLDYAEITEMHHEKKLDAPSGTSLSTAKAMLESRGKPFLYATTQKESLKGTRGGEVGGIAVHSVRLPGLLAHQEVIFGAAGQTLSLRHDTISRECYIPGVLLAIKKVVGLKGLTYGLEALLGL